MSTETRLVRLASKSRCWGACEMADGNPVAASTCWFKTKKDAEAWARPNFTQWSVMRYDWR